MATAVGIMADSYKAPAGSTFDPLSIVWAHAHWAQDPGWAPPASGGAVSTWRNAGTSGVAVTQGTGTAQPTYQAAYANLNGKPAVAFDGGDWLNSSAANVLQPTHIYVVAWLDPTHGASPSICDGGAARNLLRNLGATGQVQMYAGVSQNGTGGGTTGAFALAALFNNASSSYRVNGTNYSIGAVGTDGLATPVLGAASGGSNPFKGAIAFFAVKGSALTAGELTNLDGWAKSHYGVPIP